MENNIGAVQYQLKTRYHGGVPPPYSRKKFGAYKSLQVFQWEFVVKFHQKNTVVQDKMKEIGQQIKNLLLVLESVYGKDNYKVITKNTSTWRFRPIQQIFLMLTLPARGWLWVSSNVHMRAP
eukprot:14594503-Ditylum_brightwellii.AAC.1